MVTSISQLRADDTLHAYAHAVGTLQLNITRLCNQTCVHCHVGASPQRTEMMHDAVIDACVAAFRASPELSTVDLTGGAPELHPRFCELVERFVAEGARVIVRHNLTVTFDPHPLTGASMRWLPAFFAKTGVDLSCSLPCYLPENTDGQRGPGVFETSINALRELNRLGYGVDGSGLVLDLIHNPVGFGLPGDQAALEADYRAALHDAYGIVFSSLRAITNMPIERFGTSLAATGHEREYASRVADACNPSVGDDLMCRTLVSVAPNGELFDCDFNQALGMGVDSSAPRTIFDFDYTALRSRPITFGDHCLVCLAGAGSSCGGALKTA